jgi:hypothetical protein
VTGVLGGQILRVVLLLELVPVVSGTEVPVLARTGTSWFYLPSAG